MATDPLAFLDEVESTGSQQDPLDFLEQNREGLFSKPKESRIPAMKQEIARGAKVIGSTVAGLPGDIQELARSAPQSLLEKIMGQEIPEKFTQATRALSPFGNLPTQKELTKSAEQAFPSLEPQTQEEKDWEDNLSLITSLALPVPGGKAKAISKAQQSALYQAGIRLGLSEKDLAPLFHGKVTQGILGKLAGQGKQAAKELHLTQNALGSVYDTLKTKGTKQISEKAASHLENQLRDFRMSLEKTLSASPEKQTLINFVKKAEDNLFSSGATGEELINFYQDINKSINWNSLHGGKRQLAKAKDFVKDALLSTDKSLAKDFDSANALWGRSEGVIKSLGQKKYQDFINMSAGAAIIGALATGNVDSAEKIGLTLAAKQGLARVATKLLTDPKWINLHGKMLQAIKNKSPKATQAIIQTLKNKIREEMPEDSEELESLF